MMHAENPEPPARSLVLLLVVNFPNFHENMRIRVYDSQKPLWLFFCDDRRDENEYTNDAKLSPFLLRFNDAYSNASPLEIQHVDYAKTSQILLFMVARPFRTCMNLDPRDTLERYSVTAHTSKPRGESPFAGTRLSTLWRSKSLDT